MEDSGWEIKSAGWILLFALGILLIHLLSNWPNSKKSLANN